MAEQLHLLFQHRLQSSRGIDSQTSSSTQQSEGAEHAYQSKTMVAMQMGDEHGADFGKTQTGTAQLHLSALATVDQEQFAPDFYNLCRCIMV